MTYILDLSAGSSGTATSFKYTSSEGLTIELHGTGFAYDEHGYLSDGDITSITATDIFFGIEQTITLDVDAGDFYTDVVTPLIALKNQMTGWSKTEEIISTSATKIVVEMQDGTRVEIVGEGLSTYPTTGHVTSLEHFSANGDSLTKLSSLDVSIGVALGALGQADTLFNYMTQGENTVTQNYAFGPDIEGGLGDDTLVGTGAAFPVAEYRYTAISGIVADLRIGKVTGGAGTDTLIGIAGISGSQFNDEIYGRDDANRFDDLSGNDGKDTIKGFAGTDFISGGNGNDTIDGGNGDDRITGGAGDDKLVGGKGNDTLSFSGEVLGKGITINLNKSGKQDFGAWGKDTISGFEYAQGTGASDHIIGTNGNNTLSGNGGKDKIEGMGGNDVLFGDTGLGAVLSGNAANDTLDGGKGNDLLYASQGVDMLIGGAGKDTFRFNAPPTEYLDDFDKIKDFNVKDDTISLSQYAFEIEDGKLDKDAFVYGKEAKDHEDRLIYDKATGKLYYDEDGSGLSDDPILLAILLNKAKLTVGDFIIS